MRMQMNGVNPDSVSGTVTINGQSVAYKRGRLTYNGTPLMISDDHDLIITTDRKVWGAVINGQMKRLADLTPSQLASVNVKYKLGL